MNRLKLFAARSGDLTARWDARQLHSRFDPRVEADRFLDSGPNAAQLFVIVGPGLGYLIASIRRRFPHARVLALALHSELSRHLVASPDALWSPESDTALSDFLSLHVSDLATASVAVHEWAPVAEAFPLEAETIRSELSAHLHRSHASLVTQGATGRRWLRNRVFNYVRAKNVRPTPTDRQIRAVALVAAGPSLERSLPRLAAHRDTLEVWVTGSALEAVVARGIRPDVVVVTDAAVYATEHIRAVLSGALEGVPVAAPLCASRGIAGCERLLVLSEDDSVDRALLREADSTPVIPPHGTVTATCALLIRALTSAPILLIGADFAWASGRSHARPHLSEIYRYKDANRLSPANGRVYESTRSNEPVTEEWATNKSLATYAGWFAAEAVGRLDPVYALCPSPVLSGIPTLAPDNIGHLPARYPGVGWIRHDRNSPESRATTARDYLSHAREIAARTREPASSLDLESSSPELAELAIRLCLPDLLRWGRLSGDARASAWETVTGSVIRELDSCLGLLP